MASLLLSSLSVRLHPILRDGARVTAGSTCVIIFRDKSKVAKATSKKMKKDQARFNQ